MARKGRPLGLPLKENSFLHCNICHNFNKSIYSKSSYYTQNHYGWKGSLEIFQSNATAQAVSPIACCPGPHPGGFWIRQWMRLHICSRQPLSVFDHTHGKNMLSYVHNINALNFLIFNLCLLPLVLLLVTMEENLSVCSSFLPVRYFYTPMWFFSWTFVSPGYCWVNAWSAELSKKNLSLVVLHFSRSLGTSMNPRKTFEMSDKQGLKKTILSVFLAAFENSLLTFWILFLVSSSLRQTWNWSGI